MDVITIVLILLVLIIVLAWMDMYWKQTIILVKVKTAKVTVHRNHFHM